MYWIMQENIFNEKAYDVVIETLKRLGIPYSQHKVVPFIGELTPEPKLETSNAICIGSYAMRHYAQKHNIYPGVFDLEPYNFEVQLAHWGEEMLNADSVVSRFEDAVFSQFEMFIRPIEDSKIFAGTIMNRPEFINWQDQVCQLHLDFGSALNNDSIVQVSPVKQIYSEHRFWIVKGNIVTASTYKRGNKVIYIPNPDDIFYNYVHDRLQEWQPLDAFVIDVADTDQGIKIVEINTINSCGFYAADINKLISTLDGEFTV